VVPLPMVYFWRFVGHVGNSNEIDTRCFIVCNPGIAYFRRQHKCDHCHRSHCGATAAAATAATTATKTTAATSSYQHQYYRSLSSLLPLLPLPPPPLLLLLPAPLLPPSTSPSLFFSPTPSSKPSSKPFSTPVPPLVLSCIIHALAGRAPPAGKRGSAAGSLLSSHHPAYTWTC
jgi:hypothetical protein